MKQVLTSSFLLFLTLFFINTGKAADAKRTTLKRGIFNKQLTVVATSNGGHTGKCLKLNLTNTSSIPLEVTIDPAMIFVPDDTNYQNLVTWGTESVMIEPAATASIDVYAFCGKSYARGPRANLSYKFYRQGDSVMTKTMAYMKTQPVSMHLAQAAVWHFTNRHCLSSIYCDQAPAASENVVKFICNERKQTMPETYTEFEQSDKPGQPAFVANGQAKTYVPVKWKHTDSKRHMNVTVLKENGEVYKKIQGNDHIDKEGHTVWVEFNSVNDRKGVYYVELKDEDNKIWYKKKVIVGYDPCNMM